MKNFNKILFSLVVCALFCLTCIPVLADDSDDTDHYYLVLDAAGGSIEDEDTTEISSPKDEFGTVKLSEYKPVRDGFTFTGWYNKSKKVTSISAADFKDGENRITLVAMYTKDSYSGSGLTFTLDANGGTIGDSESGSYDFDVVSHTYGIALSEYVPKKEGSTFAGWNSKADGSGQKVDILYYSAFEKADENGYEYTDVDGTADTRNLHFYAQWTSDIKSSGKITIGKSSWTDLQGDITFDKFYGKAVSVKIEAAKGVTIGYLISGSAMSEDELAGSEFTEYTSAFTIEENGKHVVYAQLKKDDKTAYISSDGFILDTHAPSIKGASDGDVFCSAVDITIKESHLDKVTVNGNEVSPGDGGALTLSPADGPQTITATDKAGNKTEITITVNKDHVAKADDGNCTTPIVCKYCGKELQKGNAEHALTKWKSNGNGTHSRKCTNKGCGYRVTQDCHGGTATCKKKAVCKVCGAKYGSLSKTNHPNIKKTDEVPATAANEGNIEYWYCPDCGKYFSDKACTKEIKKNDTVTSKLKPTITGGQNTSWKKSGTDNLKFRSDANYSDFKAVLVDGRELNSSSYTVSEGSIIVELKPTYLETLVSGPHTLTIRSVTGDASTDFTIVAKDVTTSTTATTQTTTEATTEQQRHTYDYTAVTTEATTTEEPTTKATTETTTVSTTEKSTLTVGSYRASDSVDKSKSKVHNLQLVILITVLATILVSFIIILISSGRKKK